MHCCIQIIAFIFTLFKYKSKPWSPLKDLTKQHSYENRSLRLWKTFLCKICKVSSHFFQGRPPGKWWLLIRHMTISIMRIIIVCPVCHLTFPEDFIFFRSRISRLSTVFCVKHAWVFPRSCTNLKKIFKKKRQNQIKKKQTNKKPNQNKNKTKPKPLSSGQTDWNYRIIGKRDKMKGWKL